MEPTGQTFSVSPSPPFLPVPESLLLAVAMKLQVLLVVPSLASSTAL